MTHFGFKEITLRNWQEPDHVSASLLTNDDWLRNMLKPKLIELVPPDVQSLYEVARGAMIYGYYFYPLYTLAAEQLFRVTEAAVTHKSKALGLSNERKPFKYKINWLVDKEIIPQADLVRWNAIRELRNSASHPKRQSIITPGNALGLLENVAERINLLFSAT